MAEQLQPQQEDQHPQLKSFITLSQQYLPTMKLGHDRGVALMSQYTSIDDDDKRHEVHDTLLAIKATYDKVFGMRKEITTYLDELKANFMQYEKPLSPENKSSEYMRLRNMLTIYDQKKLEEKREAERVARQKKEFEDAMVDIEASVLTMLNNLMADKARIADEICSRFFADTTLDNFDKRMSEFRVMKPKLKVDEYEACFSTTHTNPLIRDYLDGFKKVETYEKWNQTFLDRCMPVINEWRAKIDQHKEHLTKLKNASDESERSRIADEQARKEAADKERRDRELREQALRENQVVEKNASTAKLENSFVEQITTQQLGETGPVNKKLIFTKPEGQLKALTTIIYQCMIHKKFPGIEKIDRKTGQKIKDKFGDPEYVEGVSYWVDFFQKNCDAAIPDTKVIEQTKTIIRS